jgi:hypothetical protein
MLLVAISAGKIAVLRDHDSKVKNLVFITRNDVPLTNRVDLILVGEHEKPVILKKLKNVAVDTSCRVRIRKQTFGGLLAAFIE